MLSYRRFVQVSRVAAQWPPARFNFCGATPFGCRNQLNRPLVFLSNFRPVTLGWPPRAMRGRRAILSGGLPGRGERPGHSL